MAVTSAQIAIVGCGPGSADYLTEAARQAVAEAEVLVGSRRLLDAVRPSVAASASLSRATSPRCWRPSKRIAPPGGGWPCWSAAIRGCSASPASRGALRPGQLPDRAGRQLRAGGLRPAGLGLGDARILSAHGRTPPADRRGTCSRWTRSPFWPARRKPAWSPGRPASWRPPMTPIVCENLTLDGERVRR